MKIERKDGNLVITLPFVRGGKSVYTDKVHTKEYTMSLMQTFSKFLVGALERRMQACQRLLFEHIGDICFVTEGCEHIEWPTGQFNMVSFETMEKATSWIAAGLYQDFLYNTAMVDQVLKALLNDTEPHPDKIEGFKYSELVSLLTEHHAFNNCRSADSTGSGLWIGERPKK